MSSHARSTESASSFEEALTPAELRQLTYFKWQYSLESMGFNGAQVRDLMFLAWLYKSDRVRG